MEKGKEIVSYDYKTIRVRRQLEVMVADVYEALGWEMVGSSVSQGGIYHVNLSFKRDRKVANKTDLVKLQEKVDAIIINIEVLMSKKRWAGMSAGVTTGTVGALTLGGGMAMVMELGVDAAAWMIGGIALGVVGIGICFLGWLIGVKVKASKGNKLSTMLDQEYNKLADICDEAKKVR